MPQIVSAYNLKFWTASPQKNLIHYFKKLDSFEKKVAHQFYYTLVLTNNLVDKNNKKNPVASLSEISSINYHSFVCDIVFRIGD